MVYISIDCGGTNTRVASTDTLDTPHLLNVVRRRNTPTFQDNLDFMIRTARELANGEHIDGVGVGAPGIHTSDKAMIEYARNLPDWNNKPFAEPLCDALHCPVYLENDIVAAGLGEAYYGTRQKDFNVIIWGTGMQSGTVTHSGNVARVDVFPRGSLRDWSTECSGSEITKQFAKPPEEFDDAEWKQVQRAFRTHLAMYVSTYSPKTIVFFGGLAVKHDAFIRQLGRDMGVTMRTATHGEDAGLMGGFALLKQQTT